MKISKVIIVTLVCLTSVVCGSVKEWFSTQTGIGLNLSVGKYNRNKTYTSSMRVNVNDNRVYFKSLDGKIKILEAPVGAGSVTGWYMYDGLIMGDFIEVALIDKHGNQCIETYKFEYASSASENKVFTANFKFKQEYKPIDLVVVNLYPFQSTVAQDGVTPEMARTNIDIGGPCMIRASAKNYLRVASVTDPADYAGILAEIQNGNATLSLSTRLELMKKAFAHTADYDSAIAGFFAKQSVGDVEGCYV